MRNQVGEVVKPKARRMLFDETGRFIKTKIGISILGHPLYWCIAFVFESFKLRPFFHVYAILYYKIAA